jgi:hypothetical protein
MPALVLSPVGIMLSFNVEANASSVDFVTVPFESATEIAPALARETELLQPVTMMANVMQKIKNRPTITIWAEIRSFCG